MKNEDSAKNNLRNSQQVPNKSKTIKISSNISEDTKNSSNNLFSPFYKDFKSSVVIYNENITANIINNSNSKLQNSNPVVGNSNININSNSKIANIPVLSLKMPGHGGNINIASNADNNNANSTSNAGAFANSHANLDGNNGFLKDLKTNITEVNKQNPTKKNLTLKSFENLFKLNQELNLYANNNSNNTNSSFYNIKPHVNTSRFYPEKNYKNNQFNNNSSNSNDIFNNKFLDRGSYDSSNPYNFISNNNHSQYNNTFSSSNHKTNISRINVNQNSALKLESHKGGYSSRKPLQKIKRNVLQTNLEDFELISLEQYNSLVSETMANYRTESLLPDKNDIDDQLDKENNKIITAYNSKNRLNKPLINKKFNNLSATFGSNSLIKVEIKAKDYINKKDCSTILNSNKKIYNNISTSLINIQKMYYDKTIFDIEKFEEFQKKMFKVRVCNMIPKAQDFLNIVRNKESQENAINTLISNAVNLQNSSSPKENVEGGISNSINISRKYSKGNIDEISLELSYRQEKSKTKNEERDKEKRKNKKKRDEVKLKNKILRSNETELFAYYKYSSKNFPEGREQFAFDYNLLDIVLFGGIVTNKNNNIWTLDPINLEWEKRNSDNIPPYPRYGHTGVIFQKRLYVFGGKCKSNNYHYIADLDIFDLTDNQWFTPNFSSKTVMELRRNHVAALIGNQMIIHGGINEENKILNDAYILSMSPLKWTPLNISEFTPGPYLSGHASVVVLPIDIKYNARTSIYKFPENGFGKFSSNRIREKGWYLFGGINSDDGTLTNDLWILRLGRKPLEWIKPNVRGKRPLPRYSHSLNYYEEGNFLICHGGRNDLCSQSFALNDTHIFDLSKMEWQEVKLFSDAKNFNVFNRCGHAAIIISDKLIIFGGMNNLNYLGSSLFIIKLDLNYKFKREMELDNSFDSEKNQRKNTNRSHKKHNNRINQNYFNHGFNNDSPFYVKLPPIK